MDTRSLAEALERASVDPSRYTLPGDRRPWTLPAEDQVRLAGRCGRWEVWGGRDAVPGWEGDWAQAAHSASVSDREPGTVRGVHAHGRRASPRSHG